MTLDNKTYDILKWVAQILLPAVGTLYFTLAKLWQLPAPEEVVGTIVALDTFLGALLGLSSRNYQPATDGTVHVDAGTKEVYAAVTTPTNEAIHRGTITLKVQELEK